MAGKAQGSGIRVAICNSRDLRHCFGNDDEEVLVFVRGGVWWVVEDTARMVVNDGSRCGNQIELSISEIRWNFQIEFST